MTVLTVGKESLKTVYRIVNHSWNGRSARAFLFLRDCCLFFSFFLFFTFIFFFLPKSPRADLLAVPPLFSAPIVLRGMRGGSGQSP